MGTRAGAWREHGYLHLTGANWAFPGRGPSAGTTFVQDAAEPGPFEDRTTPSEHAPLLHGAGCGEEPLAQGEGGRPLVQLTSKEPDPTR